MAKFETFKMFMIDAMLNEHGVIRDAILPFIADNFDHALAKYRFHMNLNRTKILKIRGIEQRPIRVKCSWKWKNEGTNNES